MIIRTGCDIVHIKRFTESLKSGGSAMLDLIFTPHELKHAQSEESLAGIFAVKEAAVKALEVSPGLWKSFEVTKNARGRPALSFSTAGIFLLEDILSVDMSIAHDGKYAIAITNWLIKDAH